VNRVVGNLEREGPKAQLLCAYTPSIERAQSFHFRVVHLYKRHNTTILYLRYLH